jgi:hypothetical protein
MYVLISYVPVFSVNKLFRICTRWCSLVEALCYKPESRGLDSRFVTVIFHWHNPTGRTMTLGLTHPLTEMSTRNNSWGSKGVRCVGLTTLPPSCADCLEIWELQPPRIHWPVMGLLLNCLEFKRVRLHTVRLASPLSADIPQPST